MKIWSRVRDCSECSDWKGTDVENLETQNGEEAKS